MNILQKRFWDKVQKTDNCWNWIASKVKDGYGFFRLPGYKSMRAHRFSWEFHNGTIPKGICVLHKCDNPACVNPAHLFLGTDADNVKDMMNKGRGKYNPNPAKGENHHNSKLTDKQVLEIRAIGNSINQYVLARHYGVRQPQISRILNNKERGYGILATEFDKDGK